MYVDKESSIIKLRLQINIIAYVIYNVKTMKLI